MQPKYRSDDDAVIGTATAVMPSPESRGVPVFDRWYVAKVARRQWIYAATGGVLTFVLGAAATATMKDVHKSTVVASFDRHDALTLGAEAMASIDAEGVENSFEARMADPDFLAALEQDAGLATQGRLHRLMTKVGLASDEDDAERRARLVTWFGKHLIPVVQYGTGTLTLNVYLDDQPEKAQALAALAMESFIQRELTGASGRLGVKLDFLNQALSEARLRLKDLQRESGKPSAKTLGAAPPMSPDLRQREAELIDRIRLAEGAVSDLSDERVRRRTMLESDYERLAARLAPTHPELLAKRNEVAASIRAPDPADEAARNLSRLRRELWRTRSEMLYPGAGEGVAGGFMSLEERLEATRIANLASRIEELELEKSNIERQSSAPALRTSLKVVKPASYEAKAFSQKRRQAALATLALALMAALLVTVWRESQSPLARDAWRITRISGQPILAQLAATSVGRYPRISPSDADDLRSRLAERRSGDSVAVKTLLAYRRLELAVARHCAGRVVCVASAGADDGTRDFFFSFANVVATDSGSVLVVDGNAQDPLIGRNEGGPSPSLDLLDVLTGRASWRDVTLKADGTRAFDLLSISRSVSGERTRAFKTEAMTKLFTELAASYPLVLVRALPEAQFIENVALIGAVSDLVVAVDGGKTTYGELSRTLVHLGTDKLRGLVLVGS